MSDFINARPIVSRCRSSALWSKYSRLCQIASMNRSTPRGASFYDVLRELGSARPIERSLPVRIQWRGLRNAILRNPCSRMENAENGALLLWCRILLVRRRIDRCLNDNHTKVAFGAREIRRDFHFNQMRLRTDVTLGHGACFQPQERLLGTFPVAL